MTAPESDLRAILARLDAAAAVTEAAAHRLAIDLEETRLLAAEDRIQISRLILLVQRLTAQGDLTLKSAARLERGAAHVAEDLAATITGGGPTAAEAHAALNPDQPDRRQPGGSA